MNNEFELKECIYKEMNKIGKTYRVEDFAYKIKGIVKHYIYDNIHPLGQQEMWEDFLKEMSNDR